MRKILPFFLAVSVAGTAAALFGCGPQYTYPASTVPKAIEEIGLKEYRLHVQARVAGKTVGASLLVGSLLDSNGQISKEVHEKLGKVMQVVTRVCLSTDLPVDFNVVVIRGVRDQHEIFVTRSLDDVKRAHADAIGVEESLNRTVFSQGRTAEVQENPRAFVLQEVQLENFLMDQIVQRIRFGFASRTKRETPQPVAQLVMVEGAFEQVESRRTFHISILALQPADSKQTVLEAFKTASQVIQSYHFQDFDQILIQDYLNRQKLVVDKKTLLLFQKKKISEAQILERFLIRSDSAREAFKLFGFDVH